MLVDYSPTKMASTKISKLAIACVYLPPSMNTEAVQFFMNIVAIVMIRLLARVRIHQSLLLGILIH
jgi:hypothetical protein